MNISKIIESPYNILDIIDDNIYYGVFVKRKEVLNISEYSEDQMFMEMTNCYALPSGHWIGDYKTADYLCRIRNITNIQKAKSTHCVCSIGFNVYEQKWYGWSHRAMCGFGMGDKIFEERYGNCKTPFIKHGRKTIKNMADAKLSAKRFAGSVS